jgi:Trp operon repressor
MKIHWAPGEADERDLLQVLQCFDEQNYAVQREDFSGQLLRVKLSDRQQQNSEIFAGAF